MPKAMVLEAFGNPLTQVKYSEPRLNEGEVCVRVLAAGICGSDRHMAAGDDPRTPLPIILGHEGVGEILGISGDVHDILARPLRKGDKVIWDRGITCGECFYCAVAGQSFLCTNRKVYGINVSAKEPPHLRGCFAEEIVLFPHTSIYKLDKNADPAALVSASCSGATAAHSVEEAGVKSGDTIVVIGPGPLGLWTAALAKSAGAVTVILTGTRHDRLELGKLFGADLTINVRETTESERLSAIKDASGGFGVDKVIDTSGAAGAVTEALSWLRPGGTYANSGVAVPAGQASVDLYDLNKRNLTVKGVWVSGTRHFLRAVKLAVENAFPFEKMVSHRLPLARAQEALNMGRAEGVMKVVLVP